MCTPFKNLMQCGYHFSALSSYQSLWYRFHWPLKVERSTDKILAVRFGMRIYSVRYRKTHYSSFPNTVKNKNEDFMTPINPVLVHI
jgi:hypothetical protein